MYTQLNTTSYPYHYVCVTALHGEPYIMFSMEKKIMLCINCFRDMRVWVLFCHLLHQLLLSHVLCHLWLLKGAGDMGMWVVLSLLYQLLLSPVLIICGCWRGRGHGNVSLVLSLLVWHQFSLTGCWRRQETPEHAPWSVTFASGITLSSTVVEGSWGHESVSLVLSLFVSVIAPCWLIYPDADVTVVVDRA